MKANSTVDTAKLGILLNELRLPAIKLIWSKLMLSGHISAPPTASSACPPSWAISSRLVVGGR